jgi:hypothetical protein
VVQDILPDLVLKPGENHRGGHFARPEAWNARLGAEFLHHVTGGVLHFFHRNRDFESTLAIVSQGIDLFGKYDAPRENFATTPMGAFS